MTTNSKTVKTSPFMNKAEVMAARKLQQVEVDGLSIMQQTYDFVANSKTWVSVDEVAAAFPDKAKGDMKFRLERLFDGGYLKRRKTADVTAYGNPVYLYSFSDTPYEGRTVRKVAPNDKKAAKSIQKRRENMERQADRHATDVDAAAPSLKAETSVTLSTPDVQPNSPIKGVVVIDGNSPHLPEIMQAIVGDKPVPEIATESANTKVAITWIYVKEVTGKEHELAVDADELYKVWLQANAYFGRK